MKWFFTIDDNEDIFTLVKACVKSAKKNTTLEPNCIFYGNKNKVSKWLEDNNVNVIYHQPSFLDDFNNRIDSIKKDIDDIKSKKLLKSVFDYQLSPEYLIATFLRVDIPLLTDDEYVLFTDVDLLFVQDLELDKFKPKYFAGVPLPHNDKIFNGGVLLLNTKKLKQTHKDFLKYIQNENYVFKNSRENGFSQEAYNFYKEWDKLPLNYNVRFFYNNYLDDDVKIIHFAGPKPETYKKLLEGEDTSFFKNQNTIGNDDLLNIALQSIDVIIYWVKEWYKYIGEEVDFEIKNIEGFNCPECKENNIMIIMGNGPSLQHTDFNLIKNYFTFGLKGSYSMYPKIDFWPTYWGYFDSQWLHTGNRFNEVNELIKLKKIRQIFTMAGDGLIDNEKTFCLKPLVGKYVPDDSVKALDFSETKKEVIKQLMELENINENEALILFYNLYMDNKLQPNFKPSAFIRSHKGQTIRHFDVVIPGYRYEIPEEPVSLNEFYLQPTSSALVATKVSVCLGFKKIILLGVDLNYNGSTDNNYWTSDILQKDDPILAEKNKLIEETNKKVPSVTTWDDYVKFINKGHRKYFEMFKKNNPNIEVINCSLDSKLECFPKMNLEDALNVLQRS